MPLLPFLFVGQHPLVPWDGVLVVLSRAVPGTKAGMRFPLLRMHVRDLRMDGWPAAAWKRKVTAS